MGAGRPAGMGARRLQDRAASLEPPSASLERHTGPRTWPPASAASNCGGTPQGRAKDDALQGDSRPGEFGMPVPYRPVRQLGAASHLVLARGRDSPPQARCRMSGALARAWRIFRAMPSALTGNSELVPPGRIRMTVCPGGRVSVTWARKNRLESRHDTASHPRDHVGASQPRRFNAKDRDTTDPPHSVGAATTQAAGLEPAGHCYEPRKSR